MNEKDIITVAMKSCGWNQQVLAEKCGYKSQSAISNKVNGKSLRVDTFAKILDAMGYEIVVKSKSSNSNKNQWKIDAEVE